jgi:hypothetical protein
VYQVWFQNRRAKFRRNERSVLTGKQAHQEQDTLEQPLVSKNTTGKQNQVNNLRQQFNGKRANANQSRSN